MNLTRLLSGFRLLSTVALPFAVAGASPDADMRLVATAHVGDEAGMRVALAKGADPDFESRGNRALCLAVKSGHLEVVKLLLQNRANPNLRNQSEYDDQSPLEAAVAGKDVAAVELLLKSEANPNLPSPRNGKESRAGEPSRALGIAVRGRHREITRMLLLAGARANHPSDNGDPILHALADLGWVDEAALALKQGADVNGRDSERHWTPLIYAARSGHIEMVKLLLSRGATFEDAIESRGIEVVAASANGHWEVARHLVAQAKPRPEPTLWFAAGSGDIETVRRLLDRGNKPDEPDPFRKRTSLMWAAEFGHAAIGSLLVSKGAKPAARAKDLNALYLAAGAGHSEFVSMLLKHRVDPNEPNGKSSPLHIAAQEGHLAVARLLLENGARPDGPTGVTPPLLEAAFQGHLDIVRLLVEKGADIRAHIVRKDSGRDEPAPDDALSMAVLGNHPQVIRFLVDKGVPMDGAYGSKSWTPNGDKARPLLLFAITQEKEDAACALVQAGINFEAQEEDYDTEEDKEPSKIASALTLASARGYTRLVKLLLERDIHGDNRLRRYFFGEALKGAAGEGHVAVFNALVSAAPSLADSYRLPLVGAAINGDRPEIVDLLVRRGLVPDEPGSDDVSPIVAAAAGLQPKALAALLRSRPQTPSSAGRRWTAQLNLALLKAAPYLGNRRTGDSAQLDRLEVVRLLLDAGATPDARYEAGHSALFRAGAEVSLLLLGAGADPNLKTKDGETAIHRALVDEQWNRVMVLAENGADVNVPIPYAIATYAQLMAKVTGQDSDSLPNASEKNATPLHIASANCVDKLVKVLLQKGANPRARDGAGRTPLQVTSCDEVKTLLRNAQ